MVLLSSAIQAHPSRVEMAATLSNEIGAEIVFDPDPGAILRSPWRTYREALERTPHWATHRLIVQEDALVVPHFAACAARVAAAHPDKLVTFFVAGAPRDVAINIRRACQQGDRYLPWPHGRWVPTVALMWPQPYIQPVLDFVDAQTWPERFCADDEIVGRATSHYRYPVLATVPSLADHPDDVPSVIGKRHARNGADIARIAACVLDLEIDARTIDW